MPTALKPLGPPSIGRSISFGIQSSSSVPNGTRNNRIITQDYEMRVEDQADYIVSLETPTVYHPVFTNAVIVDQSISARENDRTTAILRRVFAEVPLEWNEDIERVETFPGVAQSMLYAPAEFVFRNAVANFRTSVRINRRYFLSTADKLVPLTPFQPVNSDGVAVSVITDYTTPSADEYVAMALGRQEIVLSSVPRRWMGAIHVLETIYARAK